MTQPPYGAPEPIGPTSGRSGGFRTLLLILLGLAVAVVLTCSGALYYAWRDPTVQEAFNAAMQAQSAPGSEELRAAGCGEAAVMDLESTLDAITGGEEGERPAELPTTYVTCKRPDDREDLDCARVAEVYLAAVEDPPERFLAQVTVGLGNPECQDVYTAEGELKGPLEQLFESDAIPPEGGAPELE